MRRKKINFNWPSAEWLIGKNDKEANEEGVSVVQCKVWIKAKTVIILKI